MLNIAAVPKTGKSSTKQQWMQNLSRQNSTQDYTTWFKIWTDLKTLGIADFVNDYSEKHLRITLYQTFTLCWTQKICKNMRLVAWRWMTNENNMRYKIGSKYETSMISSDWMESQSEAKVRKICLLLIRWFLHRLLSLFAVQKSLCLLLKVRASVHILASRSWQISHKIVVYDGHRLLFLSFRL